MLIEILMSIRYLFGRRKERFISLISFISFFTIALSVMVLVVVIAVMNGFEYELKKKLLGINAHIVLTDQKGIVKDYKNIIKELYREKEVIGTSPFVSGQVIVRVKDKVTGVYLRGIIPQYYKTTSTLWKDIQGRLPVKGNEIVVGKEFAQHYGVKLGSTVHIYSPVPVKDLSKITMKDIKKIFFEHNCIVVGIFDSGLYDYDLSMVIVPLDFAQQLYQLGEGVHGINIRLIDPDYAYLVKQKLRKRLPPTYILRGWMDLNKDLFIALQTEKRVMFILLTLAVLIAATSVISVLIMFVMEKTRDIGILKALGMRNWQVGFIFLYLGLFIGVMGVGAGIVLGLLFVRYLPRIEDLVSNMFGYKLFPPQIYHFQYIPTRVQFFDIVIIGICAIILTLLSAWYPAWKASKLKPVEALRFE